MTYEEAQNSKETLSSKKIFIDGLEYHILVCPEKEEDYQKMISRIWTSVWREVEKPFSSNNSYGLCAVTNAYGTLMHRRLKEDGTF